jgi:hypothetical protein
MVLPGLVLMVPQLNDYVLEEMRFVICHVTVTLPYVLSFSHRAMYVVYPFGLVPFLKFFTHL